MMILFLKGLVIGIGKIIPGVSGALLAINFGVYDKMIDALVNFFSDWKNNLKFLLTIGSGILLSIILFSSLILYLINRFPFITMMFFIGLVFGGTYNYLNGINLSKKNIIIVLVITLFLLLISINTKDNIYYIQNNFMDNIMFFISGFIDIFASIFPGISSTAILMSIGMYENMLNIISMSLSISYIIDNLANYLSFSLGIIISFIVTTVGINFLIKKHKNIMNILISSVSISSIIVLIRLTFNYSIDIYSFIIGIIFLLFGSILSVILDK